MKKTLLILTAALGLTMSAFTARAQYYNFDVRVHQDTDWIAALPILEATARTDRATEHSAIQADLVVSAP
jgi:hypothetical protein